MQLVAILFALFGVPKLIAFMPDFDPLMLIVGIFVLLAGAQHLGLVGAAEGPGGPGRGQSSGHRPHEEQSRDHSGGYASSSRQGGRRSARDEKGPKAEAQELLLDAERCLAQNSYARVQELARKVTDLDPENVRAWELLATAQKWEGKRREAAETVRKAREIYEVDSQALKAIAEELASASADPSAAAAAVAAECEAKGEEFIARRQYDLAAECFDKAFVALEASEDKAARLRVLRRQAECAQQLQDWTACRRAATGVLEEEPNDTVCLLRRAAANEALEKFKAALDDARKLLAMEPKNAAANRIVHNCQQALRG